VQKGHPHALSAADFSNASLTGMVYIFSIGKLPFIDFDKLV
jgi:hypothetical protein